MLMVDSTVSHGTLAFFKIRKNCVDPGTGVSTADVSQESVVSLQSWPCAHAGIQQDPMSHRYVLIDVDRSTIRPDLIYVVVYCDPFIALRTNKL
jgi:hypothetical protein